MSLKDLPLRVRVTESKLVIEIGIDTLAFCSESKNGGPYKKCKVDPKLKEQWVQDVANAIERQDELGNSKLTKLLDDSMTEAADRGSGALIWKNRIQNVTNRSFS
jgi:hypothetical protein